VAVRTTVPETLALYELARGSQSGSPAGHPAPWRLGQGDPPGRGETDGEVNSADAAGAFARGTLRRSLEGAME